MIPAITINARTYSSFISFIVRLVEWEVEAFGVRDPGGSILWEVPRRGRGQGKGSVLDR